MHGRKQGRATQKEEARCTSYKDLRGVGGNEERQRAGAVRCREGSNFWVGRQDRAPLVEVPLHRHGLRQWGLPIRVSFAFAFSFAVDA